MGNYTFPYASCMETCGMEKPCRNPHCSANNRRYQQKSANRANATPESAAEIQPVEEERAPAKPSIFR